jgi:hypothetical protein
LLLAVYSIDYTDIFPLFAYMLENPKLTPFALQLDQAVLTPYILLTTREVNLPAKTALEKWCHTPGETGPAAMVSMHLGTWSS